MESSYAVLVYLVEIETTDYIKKKLLPIELEARSFLEQVIRVDNPVVENFYTIMTKKADTHSNHLKNDVCLSFWRNPVEDWHWASPTYSGEVSVREKVL